MVVSSRCVVPFARPTLVVHHRKLFVLTTIVVRLSAFPIGVDRRGHRTVCPIPFTRVVIVFLKTNPARFASARSLRIIIFIGAFDYGEFAAIPGTPVFGIVLVHHTRRRKVLDAGSWSKPEEEKQQAPRIHVSAHPDNLTGRSLVVCSSAFALL